MKKIKVIERKFEKMPHSLQCLILVYVSIITITSGVVLGIIVNFPRIRELNRLESERVKTDSASINELLNRFQNR